MVKEMMKELFEKAIGISKPWFIDNLKFDEGNRRLDIHINFEVGTKFEYISEEEDISDKFCVYDTVEKTWRHLNFFQHECYLVVGRKVLFFEISPYHKKMLEHFFAI